MDAQVLDTQSITVWLRILGIGWVAMASVCGVLVAVWHDDRSRLRQLENDVVRKDDLDRATEYLRDEIRLSRR